MAETIATAAQLDAPLSRDLAQRTADQCRAFEAVFGLAMEGKLVEAELLRLALARPSARVAARGSVQ
jgi:hypothetical protein